jgi:hypothetical protein
MAIGQSTGTGPRSEVYRSLRWIGFLGVALLSTVTNGGNVVAAETQRLYLSGRDKDNTVPWRFFCTSGANSGGWTNLLVPSQWDMHGFGTLTYRQDATNARSERGLYEHDFIVPAAWSGRRVFLVFEGAMTDTSAKLNGESVGPMHQGGFYRFKHEVTKLVKAGTTNRLAVDVARYSANESVNRAERKADYWVFAGIYRPVYLEAVPPAFVERVAIDAKADGAFAMDVFVNGAMAADTVEAQVMTLAGKPVGEVFSGSAGLRKVTLRMSVPSPKQWTAETPNLYSVEVRLKRGGEVLHTYRQRFGFRTMEVRGGDGLYVNGRKVILKGVNRHSFWPDSGRCLSEAVHRLDIETIQAMSGNAVRMSHYPPDAEFLDLCDELGLYVLDELAGWQKFYDTEIGTKLVEEMVTRDVNHPSILFWDNGNEGGFNTSLDEVFGRFDPQQRRVLHPWSIANGVNTVHYLDYNKSKVAASGAPMNHHVDKAAAAASPPGGWIYLPTEFLHGLFDGGAGAGFEDYWRMMMSNPNCAGGFIWALLDEGVKRPDGTLDVAGNQAPDGIVGPYREREASFYAIREQWSPIQVRRETYGAFKVDNHYSFTDANQCKFTWQLRRFPNATDATTNVVVLAEGVAAAPTIRPGSSGPLSIKFPNELETADAFAVRVESSTGRELWTGVWPVNRTREERAAGKSIAVEARQDGAAIVLSRADLKIAVSKKSGLLSSVELGGSIISLNNGPRLAVGKSELKEVCLDKGGDSPVVTARYSGDLKQVVWRLHNDGRLECDYSYTAVGKLGYFGMLFDYPEKLVKNKRWLGGGPSRVWKNRLGGGTFGVWANDYNNTITGYRDWVYPEFKGCFVDVRWLQLQTTEGVITIVPENVPYVQVLTPELPPASLLGHAYALLPQCGLGFLNAIPPIGSKFSGGETTGPQGQQSIGQGEYSATVTFQFGKSP